MVWITVLIAGATDNGTNTINVNGDSNTYLGEYQIKEVAPTVKGDESMRTFELQYSNASKKVMIYLDERKNCKDYIVRSKNLEVRYICSKSSFGAALVSSRQADYDPNLNAMFISQENLSNQQKIAEGALTIDYALELIACYYPDLLKRKDLLN